MMTANPGLVSRSSELKRDLVMYGQGPRFRDEFSRALHEALGKTGGAIKGEAINAFDRFILQHR
ncbi:MAG: hypothetical protein HYX94_01620 [Chloroflexi bacterium]|nr:hypothetical protein [Chloroflexota bacterium]